MSYEPTVWKAGDTVTSAKLNKLEQGVANGGSGSGVISMTITQNDNTITYTVNKTWQEIWDNNYTMIYAEVNDQKQFFYINAIDPSDFSIHIMNIGDWLEADNANGYPTLTSGNK